MGTPLGPKYIPYTYMDPLGRGCSHIQACASGISAEPSSLSVRKRVCLTEASGCWQVEVQTEHGRKKMAYQKRPRTRE